MTVGRHLRWVALAVILLAGLEAILRWGIGLGDPPLARLDPETEYELVGPAEYSRWGNRIEINAQGLRMGAIGPDPGPDERRILIVGDSVIYGNHFLDQSETIPARMTGILAKDPRLAGCNVRVLPIAVSSWGPVNQVAFLRREGSFGAVSAGIVASGHDLHDVPDAVPQILPYRTTPAIGAIGDAVQAVLERLFPKGVVHSDVTHEEKMALTLTALDDMVSMLRRQGIEPVLFYHPTVPEREGAPGPEAAVFRDWAGSREVPLVDLGDVPVGPSDYRDHIHPSSGGAAKLSIALARDLAATVPPCRS